MECIYAFRCALSEHAERIKAPGGICSVPGDIYGFSRKKSEKMLYFWENLWYHQKAGYGLRTIRGSGAGFTTPALADGRII